MKPSRKDRVTKLILLALLGVVFGLVLITDTKTDADRVLLAFAAFSMVAAFVALTGGRSVREASQERIRIAESLERIEKQVASGAGLGPEVRRKGWLRTLLVVLAVMSLGRRK